jgi:hypothetical protein
MSERGHTLIRCHACRQIVPLWPNLREGYGESIIDCPSCRTARPLVAAGR